MCTFVDHLLDLEGSQTLQHLQTPLMEAELEQSARWDEHNIQEHPNGDDPISHWVQCVSDNRETYFTNLLTGETSWTNPGSELQQHNPSAIWTGDDAEVSAIHEENIVENSTAIHCEVIETPVDTSVVDKDPVDSGEVTQWLELYDPNHQVMYYFAPHSGEIRGEVPLEATALVQHCDSDAVLSTVVSLQSAARSQQARARVAAIRQEKMLEQHAVQNNIDPKEYTELKDSIHPDAAQLNTGDSGLHNDDSQWVEVYDPATQQQYYYSPRTSETRWDSPEEFVSSLEDRKVAAAISIQSLSRRRLARKKAHGFEEECELEATCRREMNHQELLQLKGGDRFWGLDNYEREVLQKRIDDELMARTNNLNDQSYSTPLQQANSVAIPVDYQNFEDLFDEELDTERLQREQQEEHDNRVAMSYEETQQCQNGDSFWGIQAEETRQHFANIAMAQEEAASRRFAEDVLEQALNAAWEVEVQQNTTKELAARGGQEQRMQTRYLRWFYRQCISVDELLGYRWPTKQQQERLDEPTSPVKRPRHPVVQPNPESITSATPYPLDDLVVRERLENGDLRFGLRSILTVHHHSARGTNGTHFEITKAPPECAFDEVTAAALLKSQLLTGFLDQGMNGDERSVDGLERQDDSGWDASQEGELTPGSSVNYRHSKMPDPHIPARFNGVPYKPNQISPTREILSGDHRKLNQLPSLTKLKPSADVPKIRQLQKAKIKARAKSKAQTVPVQQSSNNGSVSDSAREREADQNIDIVDDGPLDQFKRQEHDVLFQLFGLMDLDGSGTVNQDEMRWALQRDAEIHALARTSPLLCLLLKQRTQLEALFSSQAVEGLPGAQSESDNELSWDEFLAKCEASYLRLMSEGLIQPNVTATADNRSRGDRSNGASDSKIDPAPPARETEAGIIRRVFALLDNDHNGVLEVAEVQQALYNSASTTPKSASGPESVSKELRALVIGSRALQPMLHQELFMTAFTKFEPMDPRGISEEEFVAFCLEIAHVAAANNMVATVG